MRIFDEYLANSEIKYS